MIRSIFKMMWKRRKRSRLIIAELFISFIMLFALSTTIIKIMSNYLIPLGFDYRNVWTLSIDAGSGSDSVKDSLAKEELFSLIIKEVRTFPEVVKIANNAYNIPFSDIYRTDIKYLDKVCSNVPYIATDNAYPEVMQLKILEGRWFDNSDAGQKEIPIVINSALKEFLFGNEPALNKIVQSGLYKVVGTVDNFKINGDWTENAPVFFLMMKPEESMFQVLIRSTPEAGEAFRSELITRTSALAKDWTINIGKLSEFRNRMSRANWTPVIIISVISGFLILNILMGLMGLLWYNISHRKSEIGLRKTAGASANKIIQQFTIEMLVLTTLGVIPGLAIAAQLPILKVFDVQTIIYVVAMVAATLMIYLIVSLCSILPSAQAAKIQPAEALHEE